jgi:protein-disulfide isomerase
VLEKHAKEIKLVFKHFPLNIHPFALPAAQAAAAAQEQGRFWDVHDRLMQNGSQLNPEKIRQIAQESGLDMKRFEADMSNPKIMARIEDDIRQAQVIGVRGTPAVFVNGRLLQNRSPQGLEEAVEAALKEPPKPGTASGPAPPSGPGR